MSLDDLERRVRHELDQYVYPEREWVVPVHGPDGVPAVDVAIVGGGMAGIATAIGLRRERITNVVLFDRNPAGEEGPWVTFARMPTLRTVKELTGPDADLVSLTFRSWYEAQFGEVAWKRLHLIDRRDWMAYLVWLRRVMAVPVRNDTLVRDVVPVGELLRLDLDRRGEQSAVWARRVVIATGYDGQGVPRIPEFMTALPRSHWAHTSDPIDFTALAGKRIGVLGGGASAFDNSATALDAGARAVVQCIRRDRLPEVNWMRYAEFAGFFRGFPDLDDARRIAFTRQFFAMPTPPPQDTLERVLRHTGFALRTGSGWTAARMVGDQVEVTTTRGTETFDFLILGTGYELDITRRPELARIVPDLRFWSDAPALGDDAVAAAIGRFPYLGDGFQCQPRHQGAAPAIAHIHILGPAALPSLGPVCVGMNGMPYAIPRVVGALSRSFFLEGADRYHAALARFDERESSFDLARERVGRR